MLIRKLVYKQVPVKIADNFEQARVEAANFGIRLCTDKVIERLCSDDAIKL